MAIGEDHDAVDPTIAVGKPAPAWEVDSWMNTPGAAPLAVADLRGKVVLVRLALFDPALSAYDAASFECRPP